MSDAWIMDGETERESAVLFLRGVAASMERRRVGLEEHVDHAHRVAQSTLETMADSIERGHHIISREGWRERAREILAKPAMGPEEMERAWATKKD